MATLPEAKDEEERLLLANLQLVLNQKNGKPSGPAEERAFEYCIGHLVLSLHRTAKAFQDIAKAIKADKSLLK